MTKEELLLDALRQLEELKKRLYALEIQQIVKQTELPVDVLQENGYLPPPPKKFKRGKGYRPILKGEILEAKNKTKNETEAAKYVGVSFKTYRKYAKLYEIWNPTK